MLGNFCQFVTISNKKAPTHILQHSSSCIDLIFVNQPNLVVDSGIHPSLH